MAKTLITQKNYTAIKKAVSNFENKNEKTKPSKYTEWYKKQNLTIVEKGFKVSLPVKNGFKEFEAIKLSNGKIAVYTLGGSVLKYAW